MPAAQHSNAAEAAAPAAGSSGPGHAAAGTAAGVPATGEGAAPAAAATTTTSVYITGLPLDCTEEEVAEEFSRVCGIIREDDAGNAKVKLYRYASPPQTHDLPGDFPRAICPRPEPPIRTGYDAQMSFESFLLWQTCLAHRRAREVPRPVISSCDISSSLSVRRGGCALRQRVRAEPAPAAAASAHSLAPAAATPQRP